MKRTALTYTLKELVALLAPPTEPESAPQIARQVRHWTTMDLLNPTGGKSTGTGIHRRYDANEVRKAAILLELANYRVPAPVLEETFPTASEHWLSSPRWRDAIDGKKTVFLRIAYSDHAVVNQIVARNEGIDILEGPSTPERQPFSDFVSAIVINLTRLFARIRL